MNPKKETEKSKSMQNKAENPVGFTDEERAAMKERAKELKAEARVEKKREEGESDIQEKIAEMPESEQAIARWIHQIIKDSAPDLMPKTWYGMPAYAKDGDVICFFQAASKFKTRYATLGFNDSANLDDGDMWPTAFAVKKLTSSVEKQIVALVKKAMR
jgi:uncharacterized protein YdhG (YjbR/CyaY superfamily)